MSEPSIDQPWPGVDFVGAVKRYWAKYAVFTGRASRSEYWWPVLANVVISTVLYGLGSASKFFLILYFLFFLASVVPSIAVGIRRLHDINKSGWWWLIVLIPIVGGIWLLVLTCQPSDPAGAQYDV
jgi:uncharacterized membrane protein YhaH (DUF805 family)